MAIARKPKKTDDKSQVDVDALINKGGSVAKLAENTSRTKLQRKNRWRCVSRHSCWQRSTTR